MEQPSKLTRLRDLIAFFLPDYLRLVEPDLVPHLDLSRVDFPHLPFAPQTVVAEVCTREEEKVTVLVRVEREAESTEAARQRLASSCALCGCLWASRCGSAWSCCTGAGRD